MTQGEKMVWAAVFAAKHDISNPPRHCLVPHGEETDKRWQEWEANQAVSAIEFAGYAVLRLREVEGRVADGFGEDSDVYQLYMEMTDR